MLRETVARLLPERRGSVLVADDDPAVRRLLVATLERDDIDVREARNGEEALAAIGERRPDALVLDLVMPGMDGFAVLERLQGDQNTRTLPVVVLTAKRLSSEERSHLGARALSPLEKSSYPPAELRMLIDRSLALAD